MKHNLSRIRHPIDNLHRKTALEKIIKRELFTLGAEIGVHEGITYKHLLNTCDDLKLIGVDPYIHGVGMERYNSYLKEFVKNNNRATFYLEKSEEAQEKILDNSLDFVFIDAEHTYDAVLQDIKLWSPKVKNGGYIIGHDITYETVYQAVHKIFGRKFDTDIDRIWYAKK